MYLYGVKINCLESEWKKNLETDVMRDCVTKVWDLSVVIKFDTSRKQRTNIFSLRNRHGLEFL